ncbi:uncharacterized protein AMSG_10964 [Thecamonas trahens ATCC 50062]|uniref:Uncharacterized protein n=1 Tax=Thecamonas trahens ATCC 50062 TaxID=461836 RepID=A0A0L0DSJ6_THETB|nr:hypothetical protein AMSG_10964 [Thecamonas trahens ATCC 50062]KNC55319.1 hypothetical protein AMSG_10964 [Thecamonas trahens ATCC 50062]|eukprot:XP_013753042.1 hypothetical protein AMSG_10964 [Thecamonas trahens ATCC 50062]
MPLLEQAAHATPAAARRLIDDIAACGHNSAAENNAQLAAAHARAVLCRPCQAAVDAHLAQLDMALVAAHLARSAEAPAAERSAPPRVATAHAARYQAAVLVSLALVVTTVTTVVAWLIVPAWLDAARPDLHPHSLVAAAVATIVLRAAGLPPLVTTAPANRVVCLALIGIGAALPADADSPLLPHRMLLALAAAIALALAELHLLAWFASFTIVSSSALSWAGEAQADATAFASAAAADADAAAAAAAAANVEASKAQADTLPRPPLPVARLAIGHLAVFAVALGETWLLGDHTPTRLLKAARLSLLGAVAAYAGLERLLLPPRWRLLALPRAYVLVVTLLAAHRHGIVDELAAGLLPLWIRVVMLVTAYVGSARIAEATAES